MIDPAGATIVAVDDDVVETLSSDRADHALDERILPGTRRRGHDLGDGHARHAALAQRQIVQDQFSMSTNSQRQRPTDDDQQLEHVLILAGAGARINSEKF
jgi:hypothetical protein